MQWRRTLYIDTVLLRSALCAVADGLIWIIQRVLCHPSIILSASCHRRLRGRALGTTISLCEELGVPIASEKMEGSNTKLTFLGIKIDTQALQLHLPEDKLADLKPRLEHWGPGPTSKTARKSGKKRLALAHWGPASCHESHQTRGHICEEPDRCLNDSQGS